MKRTNLNFLVACTAFVGFVLLIATGVLIKYLLPPGSGRQTLIWGMDRHQWGDVHFWTAVAIVALMVLHVYLHWTWIKIKVKGLRAEESGRRVAVAVVALLLVLTAALLPLLSPKEIDESRGTDSHEEERVLGGRNEVHINGSMTLRDVEETTGVAGADILQALGLPENLDLDRRLGNLKREYDFEIDDIRRIVKELE